MQKSDTIGELAKALASAQGLIEGAKKDSENPFFKSKYADLASVRDACQSALSKNGLAVVQVPSTAIGEHSTVISVETLLMHSSGEWILGDLSAIPVKEDPQGIGSCITYLRRYALAAFAGVAPEDDDGNAASGPSNGKPMQRNAPPPRQPSTSQASTEITQLKAALVSTCKLLNEAGDKPVWGAKRLDEFSIQELGKKADDLELEALRELLKKLSHKLDLVKKGAKANPVTSSVDDHVEKERQAKIAALRTNAPEAIAEAIERLKYDKPLEMLSLDQLMAVDDEMIPF